MTDEFNFTVLVRTQSVGVMEYIFSPFLPLDLLSETCETVIGPFHATSMTLLVHSFSTFS